VLLVLGLWSGVGAYASTPAEMLEKGIYAEETKGDLLGAIQLYNQIAADPTADRSYVAQAQLRSGLCHLKAGQKSQAVSVLDKLTHDFPDKEDLYAMVEKQMPLLLDEIVRQIEQNYIKEVDRSELLETAIRAIVGKLDQQSDFLGPDELLKLNQSLDQELGGIGSRLEFVETTRQIMVQTPLPGSPAFRSGIRAGDQIVTINNMSVSNFTTGQEMVTAVKMIQGPPGEPLTLGIQHAGSDQLDQISIVREAVHLQSVLGDRYRADNSWEFMLDDQQKIGYIRLQQIGKQSADEMQAALTELTARGLKGLILDLRDSPGGMLAGAVAIADLFVSEGTIVTVRGRSGEARVFNAKEEGTFSGFRMAVLVDRNTASAGEIIAACLQDHRRAAIVGERTFGQAMVKNIIPLQGGKSALKLATAAYFRPSGKNMHRYPNSTEADDWGVVPDENFQVTLSEEEIKGYQKYRQQKDVIREGETPVVEFNDRLLQRALAYLAPDSTQP
jgi:carboxyl-terminal processing protease